MKNLLNNNRLCEMDFLEDDVLDTAPNHLPFRFNLDKVNKIQDSWEDKWEKRSCCDKYWQQCRRIDALIKKSIGQPFSLIYSKVCNEYPKMMRWGRSLKEYFMDQFRPSTFDLRRGGYYYIDDNGLIQVADRIIPKRTKIRSIIKYSDKPVTYKVNHDEIQNHTPLMNTIYYTMGKEAYYKLLDSKEISEKFYNEIKKSTNYDEGVYKIIDRLVWRWEWNKTEHKNEYKQIKAEDYDLQKKKQREYKKEREEYLDNLIQYLTWKRKQAEHPEPDEQNRDRHGFDDKSFKKEKEV